MDLLNQLKTLRDTTKSPEVRSICESHINMIESGNISDLNEKQIIESVQSLDSSVSVESDPYQKIRLQELDRSKAAAQKIMESWSGLGRNSLNNSGSYLEEKVSENPMPGIISESLSQSAQNDSSTRSFLESQKVFNLGVYESILNIKESGIYDHPQMKIVIEKYQNLLKVKGLPEFLVVESFVNDIYNFTWDERVKSIFENISNSVGLLKPEIEVAKTIYSIERSAGSDFYSPVLESLNKWMISENKSVNLLSKDISRWSFNPAVRGLLNSLRLMESSSKNLNVPVNSLNTKVSRLFSPVLIGGGKTIFTIGNNIFEASGNGLRRLNSKEFMEFPEEYRALLESFYAPYVKVNEEGLSVYVGDKSFKIFEENGSTQVSSRDVKLNTSDKLSLSKQISLEISGIFGINESRVVSDIIRLFENYESIVEIDFAKRLESHLYEGASVNLIKWDGKIYLNRINESMRENSLYEVNGTQATSMIKDFLKYDISEGLTEFLQGESKIKSIMINDRAKIMENIAIIEAEINKINDLMDRNPIYSNSQEIERAHAILEMELNALRKKWQLVNQEIETIESGIKEQSSDLYEEDKFNIGSYVKVKESGNTGKIISVDSTSGSYTVLMDNGRTGDYRVDEIVDIEEALKGKSEESDYDMESDEEIKEQELSVAPAPKTAKTKFKTPASSLKSNTSSAPDEDSKGSDKTSSKKSGNGGLEEAPEGKEKATNFDVKIKGPGDLKMGYNVNENDEDLDNLENGNMAHAPEDSNNPISEADIEKTNQNFAQAPGGMNRIKYPVRVTNVKQKNPEISKLNQELAQAPTSKEESPVDFEVNDEMGYNLGESLESKKN